MPAVLLRITHRHMPAVLLLITHRHMPAGVQVTHRHMPAVILRLAFTFTIPHQVCVSLLPGTPGVHIQRF